MKADLYILFGALLTATTSLALGLVVFRALALQFKRGEERLLAFVTGSAVLSGIVFILCCVRLARKGVFLAVAAGAIFAAIRMRGFHPPGEALPAIPRIWRWLLGMVFSVFTVLYFFNAMAPEMSPDGTAYHLVFPAEYYHAHGFVRIPWNMYANLSQGMELLFLFAYAFGKNSAAALVHFCYLAVLPWLMAAYARRSGFTAVGVAGAIFFFASPVVGMDGSIAYVDVAVAAVLFSLFYLLQIWDAERNSRILIPIGILMGFSFAIKYTAFLAIPYAAGFLAWRLWRSRQPLLRPLAVTTGIALLFVVPWLVKNWLWMANPVTPFANRVFPNPYVHVSFEAEYRQFQRTYGLTTYKQIPRELTLGGAILGGVVGPLFLLTPLALLALRRSAGRRLLFAGAVFALPYLTNVGTRFLIPCSPFISLALALALANWEWLLLALALGHSVASWPPVLSHVCNPYAWRLMEIPVAAALRIEPEDSFLSRKFPGYVYDRTIERLVPPGETVFAFSQFAEAYTSRKMLVRYLSAPNQVLGDILWTPLYPEFQPGQLLDHTFSPRTVRKIRLRLNSDMGDGMWSVSEFRVFNQEREVPRAPHWRLTAKPNPWEVQLAFDNSEVTRWRTWQPGRPGMYVEIDFGAPRQIDGARVETQTDQRDLQLRLDTMDGSGKWTSIPPAWTQTDRPIRHNLRMAATNELKSRGIRYLLVGVDDIGAEDLQQHAAFWGVKFLAESGYTRLYHIE